MKLRKSHRYETILTNQRSNFKGNFIELDASEQKYVFFFFSGNMLELKQQNKQGENQKEGNYW